MAWGMNETPKLTYAHLLINTFHRPSSTTALDDKQFMDQGLSSYLASRPVLRRTARRCRKTHTHKLAHKLLVLFLECFPLTRSNRRPRLACGTTDAVVRAFAESAAE